MGETQETPHYGKSGSADSSDLGPHGSERFYIRPPRSSRFTVAEQG